MKIIAYKEDKTNISRYTLQALIPELKVNDAVLGDIHSQVIQHVPHRLNETFSAFFKRGYGFPRFRSCKNFFGITYPQAGYSVQDKIFHTRVYGGIKLVKHRDFQGTVKIARITSKDNKWFLSITTDHEREKTGKGSIGIDVGITNLVALSNGVIIKNKTHAKYFDKQINKLKSRRDKCKKNSRKTRHLNRVVQRLYGVKGRKINDFQHKVSRNLSSKYDTIFIEDLNVKQMSEGIITGLNRELRNASISSFLDKLKYKTKLVIEVRPKNTSKTCNNCGRMHNMPLYKRTYICECGHKEDRDVNAAKNIYCLGQAILNKVCTVDNTIQEALAFKLG